MKRLNKLGIQIVGVLAFVGSLCAQTYTSGNELLRAMHQKHEKGPCKTYTFSQKNTHYKGDTVSGQSVWYEAVQLPDKFRIDFGDRKDGNFVIFKNDSVFNFKAGKQTKSRTDSNTLLLILGGMYYRSFDDVLARLASAGYKAEPLSSQKWNGSDVFVIGAMENDLKSNQIWVDKATLRVLRIIEKMNAGDIMDMRFESHQKWCNGYVETKVSFRRNGVLEQVEEYYDIKEVAGFPEERTLSH